MSLGDGTPWIRNEHPRRFPRAIFVVDWYHASEHLWDCGKALFGEGTPLNNQWVQERLPLLWAGQTRALLEDLKEQRRGHRGGKRQALDDLIRYLSTNEQQMRYDVFRAHGYDIGSGAVLALRITWLNAEWDSF